MRCNRTTIFDLDADLESALEETKYLLSKWNIMISVRGFCWVQPRGSTLSPECLSAFLTLFSRCCDDVFPRGVVIDLSRVRVEGEQWCLAFDVLREFAISIGARCRVTASKGRPASAVFIDRTHLHANPIASKLNRGAFHPATRRHA